MILRAAALQSKLHDLEGCIGYEFAKRSLLELAVTHRSFGQLNNERLEFLGDSVLNFVVAENLYNLFPAASEGELSRFRARFVRQETLAEIARHLGLGQFLNLGSGELRAGGSDRPSILADALEALIGAVYLDGGFECARDVALRLISPLIADWDSTESIKDPKTQLQEALQGRRIPLPEYRLVAVTGPAHAQEFHVLCLVERLGLEAAGTGASRRMAEQVAAAKLLEAMPR